MNSHRYDIDGLRAIAIILVIIFHAFPAILPSGFIGVDIFFVISGYVITNKIYSEIENKTFSIFYFYNSRINRILPPLLIVLITTSLAGFFLLFPDEVRQLAIHTLGGVTFSSNFILLHEIGYFDNTAITKPLLNLWSLSIEEQFYIVWPFFLLKIITFKKDPLYIIFPLILILLYIYTVITFIDDNLAFYLPITRFWELVSGSAIAIHESKKPRCQVYKKADILIHFFGVALLSAGILLIKGTNPLYIAIFPILGTCFLLYSNYSTGSVTALLSSPVFVSTGKMSYSLYLWHWPILSYLTICFSKKTTSPALLMFMFITLTLILSFITHYFVEKIRYSKNKKTPIILLLISAILGLTALLFSISDKFTGAAYRFFNTTKAYNYSQLEWDSFKSKKCEEKLGTNAEYCIEFGNDENQKLAIIGDSTSNAISPGIANLYKNSDIGIVNFGAGTCPPILGLSSSSRWGGKYSKLGKNCLQIVNREYDYIIKSKTINTAILVFFAPDIKNWEIDNKDPNLPLQEKFNEIKTLINKSIDILKNNHKKIIITYDMPLYPKTPRYCMHNMSTKDLQLCNINQNALVDREPYLGMFDDFFKFKKDVCIVHQSNVLIKNNRVLFFDKKNKLLLRDSHHLSYYGSDLISKEFIISKCLSQ